MAVDPEVREAALRLFRASDDFRQAYVAWTSASGPEAPTRQRRLSDAERSIDRARAELGEAQRRAREHVEAPPKQFRLDL